jgi:hypothetical protein
MDAFKHQTVNKFSGVNNVDSATRLFPSVINNEYVYPLQRAMNVDIDNSYMISSRSGRTSIKTGTDIHSMWSDNITCLYVDGSYLYSLDSIYTATSLRSDLNLGARMSYCNFNDRIYYTNGYQIGYIFKSTSNDILDPELSFKLPLPPGQLIAYFMGCLYVAVENKLYISDPLCDYYDVRTGYRIFKERIGMLRPVDDGIYISTDHIYFLNGKSNEDFVVLNSYPEKAIPYTDIQVSGKYMDNSIKGNIAMWTGESGICIADNSGTVTNLTEERYTFSSYGYGSGFIRESGNIRHYINSLY